ncbi:LacI family transcriptional regulator [Streptacidiphilus sp. MAP12-20]|uniref:LacI family DNA-binding transcriptional regulator n=1 Tax=Streptacidiphilus sp. MAP12-20 TaxID=3156299 RepID=UPI00351923DD
MNGSIPHDPGRSPRATGAGRGRPGIRQVAERAGVSTATVSRILNGSYPDAPATRAKVLAAVSELGYVANPHARALHQRRSGTIAIAVGALDDGVLGAIVQSIANQAALAERLCLIATTGWETAHEARVLAQLQAQGADALIVVGSARESEDYQRRMRDLAQALAAEGTRLVLCGRPAIAADAPAVVVEFDQEAGALAATRHLLALGHRRILHLSGPLDFTMTTARQAGYRRALAEHGRDTAGGADALPVLQASTSLGREGGHAAMTDRLAQGGPDFTAVLAANDSAAAGVSQALREAGLRVPEDVSVIGFDDVAFAADLGLTTVHIPARELGLAAFDLATRPDQPAGALMLPTRLVVRATTGPAPG